MSLALVVATVALSSSTGWAHAIVVASLPARNSTVTVGDLAVRLEFNSRIDQQRSRMTLRAPDGGESPVLLVSSHQPAELVGRAHLAVGGNWTLRWQVLAIDGHISRGEIAFVVARPAGGK